MPLLNETVIAGVTYSIAPLDANRGFPLLAKFGKFLGGAVAVMLAIEPDQPVPLEVARTAGKELGEHVASPDFLEVVYGLCEGVTILEEGKPPRVLVHGSNRTVFGAHFRGNYKPLGELMVEALRVNFGGFFDENSDLAGTLAARLAALAAKGPSPRQDSPGK